MSESTRAFFAIPVPPLACDSLTRLVSRLQVGIPQARWVKPVNWHLTLAFLGDVASNDLPLIAESIAGVARSTDPIELRFSGVGVYPNPSRPRVLWAGLVGDDLPRLFELHEKVARTLAEIDHPTDHRFSAHVTLARFHPGKTRIRDLPALLSRYSAWTGETLRVDEVVLYRSILGPQGPTYSPLAHCPLSAHA